MSFETYRQEFLESRLGGRVWDDGTMYLYVAVLVLVILFGQLAEIRRKTAKQFWFVAAGTVLAVILGFRGSDVGIDTLQYTDSFNHALEENYWSDSTSEPGYHLLMMALRFILPNATMFQVLMSALTVFFVFNTLWKNRKSINLVIAFSFYVGLFFFQALEARTPTEQDELNSACCRDNP